MKKGKRIKRWGSLALAFATVAGGITVSSPQSANAAGDFAGELISVDSAKADGNIVNISFNGYEFSANLLHGGQNFFEPFL